MVSNGGRISITLKVVFVTFGENKPHHFKSLKNREWLPGNTKVEEFYEYKNLGVVG